jgi:hypothetical protein
MSTIDSSSPLLAQLRAEALAWSRRAEARDGGGAVKDRPRAAADRAPDWLARVAQALAAIDRDDPQRQRRAFRAYLQAVLARECRIDRVEDPAFEALVDRVQDTMEADPRLRKAIVAAGDLLLQNVR